MLVRREAGELEGVAATVFGEGFDADHLVVGAIHFHAELGVLAVAISGFEFDDLVDILKNKDGMMYTAHQKVVTTMADPSLPLTVTEWEEWGDPRQMPAAEYMLAYSPYDHTTARAYPALLVTAGLNDPRVSYHEPAKWVAKLRAVATGDATLLLRTEMGAGHGGPSGRYEVWRDEARMLAFQLVELGVV